MTARALHKILQSPQVLDLSEAATRERISASATQGIVRLADAWRLPTREASALTGVSDRTWARMKAGERLAALSQDALTRISLLIGIFKGLRIVFSEPLADEWVGLANSGPPYAGRRPLDVMRSGGIPMMIEVRRHVDAMRGGL